MSNEYDRKKDMNFRGDEERISFFKLSFIALIISTLIMGGFYFFYFSSAFYGDLSYSPSDNPYIVYENDKKIYLLIAIGAVAVLAIVNVFFIIRLKKKNEINKMDAVSRA